MSSVEDMFARLMVNILLAAVSPEAAAIVATTPCDPQELHKAALTTVKRALAERKPGEDQPKEVVKVIFGDLMASKKYGGLFTLGGVDLPGYTRPLPRREPQGAPRAD